MSRGSRRLSTHGLEREVRRLAQRRPTVTVASGGGGGDAATLDGIDSTGFALVGHTHAGVYAPFTMPVYTTAGRPAAAEAAAVNYAYAKDTGFPGAWVPGTPGLNGAAADCSTTAGATILGAPYLPNPASGSNYLTYGSVATTVVHSTWLADILWYNTGLVVTTTTAQGITTPTFPARDNQGSTNGEGYQAAIYVTTATTQAGAVTTITLNYTNSVGTASRTATMASFPATAVLGTWVPFQLQAGDRGIRSIQGITLGTTLTAGAISLVVFNYAMRYPVGVANVGTVPFPPQSPGVRMWNGACLWLGYQSSATTATTINGDFWIMER